MGCKTHNTKNCVIKKNVYCNAGKKSEAVNNSLKKGKPFILGHLYT